MKNLNMSLKAFAVLTLTFVSLQSRASVDCEDVRQFSSDSTQLSARIASYEQHKNEAGADARLAAVARDMVAETEQSLSINAQENSQFEVIQELVQNGLNNRREASLKSLRQGQLQILNHLRLEQMSQIRQQYAKCFSSNLGY